MKIPDDMEQRVMGRLKSKNRSHLWLRSVSIVAAACVLILLTLHYASKNVEPKEKPLTAQKTELQDGTIENGGQTSVGKEHMHMLLTQTEIDFQRGPSIFKCLLYMRVLFGERCRYTYPLYPGSRLSFSPLSIA